MQDLLINAIMKKVKVSSEFVEFESPDQLDQQERGLLEKAREARDKAYAPYS